VLVPAQNFATADGTIAVVCFKEKFWERLCAKLGRPELAEDPRFRRFPDRLAHKDELLAILKPIFAARPSAEWAVLLGGEVPSAPVNDLETALREPQLAAREMIVTVEHPTAGPIREVGCPIKVGAPPPLRPAPRLGEHADEVLEQAGIGRDERADLRAAGVLG
jgi:crotonobetainyl-CoA:carnitine CoA-transferase CaiB-like acyl-CoA transferase